MNIEELFLSQEESNKLIESGFNWNVLAIYTTEGQVMTSGETKGFNCNHHYYKQFGAITKEQARLWNNEHYNKLFRVEIIDNHGRAYTNTKTGKVELSFQDDNRTLKIFIERSE